MPQIVEVYIGQPGGSQYRLEAAAVDAGNFERCSRLCSKHEVLIFVQAPGAQLILGLVSAVGSNAATAGGVRRMRRLLLDFGVLNVTWVTVRPVSSV